MPFGLTNAPAVFQHMMDDVFRDLLDECVIVYIDDILIYSPNQELHDQNVQRVLERLHQFGLYAKLEKCYFDQRQVEFLGFLVSPNGITMDPQKVSSLLSWEPPESVQDVQCFLGFANFYRTFIQDFSSIAVPLNVLPQNSSEPF